VCRQHVTYHWKTLDEGYNFASNLIVIGGLHAKLCTSKVTGIIVVGISLLPFGNPKTKKIWMWALWRAVKYTIKGKVVASPKSGQW
jgi:hypothetical protein